MEILRRLEGHNAHPRIAAARPGRAAAAAAAAEALEEGHEKAFPCFTDRLPTIVITVQHQI